MKELEFWDEIEGIGELNMEMELVVAEEPVLFVCSLEQNPEKKYLIMAYNSFKGKYVIREIDNQELLMMLENQVTMEQTFRNGKEIIMTHLEGGILQSEKYNSEKFSTEMLPKKGAYYNIHSQYILEYIETLKENKYRINLKVGHIQYFECDIENVGLRKILSQDILNNQWKTQSGYIWNFDISEDYQFQPKYLQTISI